MQTDQVHFDDQCPSLDSVCMSSFSNPPSLGGQPPLPSSLHDHSLPDNGSSNLTKLSRPICNTPSSVPPSPALVTIDESDEDILSSDDEKNVFVQPLKRGTLERSPSKSQRMKNFKGLRIDLVAAKNRMRSQSGSLPGQRNAKVADGNVNTETGETENRDQHHIAYTNDDDTHGKDEGTSSNDSESDYYPSDFDFDESMKESDCKIDDLEEYPSDFEAELEKGIQEAESKIKELRSNNLAISPATEAQVKWANDSNESALDKSPEVTRDKEEAFFQEISDQIGSTLSDEEMAFDNLSLSMDISGNLSEDEHIFDKLSMNLGREEQLFEEPEKNNGASKINSDLTVEKSPVQTEEKEGGEAESQKARQSISFWEEKLAKPKISLKEDFALKIDIVGDPKTEVEQESGDAKEFQSTVSRPKPAPRKTKEIKSKHCDDISDERPRPKSSDAAFTKPEKCQTEPDEKEEPAVKEEEVLVEEKFTRFTRQRSTVRRSKRVVTKPKVVVAAEPENADTAAAATSAPVPKKRESLAKKNSNNDHITRRISESSDKGLDLFMDKNIKTDKDELTRKISESLEQRTKVNPYVDIKTWEERRNQPGRKLPEKELLGWF